jgi:hypothetical protein
MIFNILTFDEFLHENSRETLPSETSRGAETSTSRENQDLEDIRFFRGSIKQWNEYLAKKIKDEGGEPNPYKNMKYIHPTTREENEGDFISYQDFANGETSLSNHLNKNRKQSSGDSHRY